MKTSLIYESSLVIQTVFPPGINGFRLLINLDGRAAVGAVLIFGTKFSNHIKYVFSVRLDLRFT